MGLFSCLRIYLYIISVLYLSVYVLYCLLLLSCFCINALDINNGRYLYLQWNVKYLPYLRECSLLLCTMYMQNHGFTES